MIDIIQIDAILKSLNERIAPFHDRNCVISMLADDRRTRLLELIRVRGFAALPDLAEELQVSESTIRRDLDFLEESGTQGVGDPKDSAQHSLGQRIEESAFIGVHRRPIFMCRVKPILLRANH